MLTTYRTQIIDLLNESPFGCSYEEIHKELVKVNRMGYVRARKFTQTLSTTLTNMVKDKVVSHEGKSKNKIYKLQKVNNVNSKEM